MSLTHRLATRADIAQLVTLRVAMQLELNRVSITEVDDRYRIDVEQYFVRSMQARSYLSAVTAAADNELVAAAGLVLYEKPPSLSGRNGRVGYVTNVYTLPEWRGRGIATQLMKLIVEQAQAIGADRLHLGATDAGLGVYEQVGFKRSQFPALELKF